MIKHLPNAYLIEDNTVGADGNFICTKYMDGSFAHNVVNGFG